MKKQTAEERRSIENAVLNISLSGIFDRLSKAKTPLVKLEEVAGTASGGTPSRDDSSNYGGKIPWLKSGELNDGLVTQIQETITERALASSSAKLVPKGTVLVAMYGATVGKTGILGLEAATNQAVCAITPRKKDLRSSYLFWFLRSKRLEFLKSSFGGAQPNISQQLLRNTLIPIPSIEVQESIAKFLSAVEKREKGAAPQLPELVAPLADFHHIVARIEALAARIAEARGLREEGVQETYVIVGRAMISAIDEGGWNTSKLGDVLSESPRNGLSPKSEVTNGGRPMLRINAVSSSPTRYVDLSAVKIVGATDREAAPFTLQNGDVFIVRYNGDINRVAKPAIFCSDQPTDVVFPDKLMRLRPHRGVMMPDFLVYALSTRKMREQVEEFGKTTAGNIGINGGNVKSFVIAVPPLEDQRRIVAELDALQSRVAALKALQAETAAELAALLPAVLEREMGGGVTQA